MILRRLSLTYDLKIDKFEINFIMSTQREKIIKKAIEILKKSPKGIKYSELVKQIHKEYPER